jgi:hypothetical protein
MHLTDISFEYLGDHDLLGNVERGALISNEAEEGDTKVSLMWWDDGFSDVQDHDGKIRKVQDRTPRLRPYDGLVEATITRLDDGTFKVSGISTAARAHPAFGPDEDRVDIKVKPGPNCRDCGHD